MIGRRASDCFAIGQSSQQSMSVAFKSERYSARNIPAWQTLRSLIATAVQLMLIAAGWTSCARGQLYDSLDAHPPRWHLDSSDCDARVTAHKHLADGGVDGRGCEIITLTATNGSEAILVYPIEPVRAIDDLTANLSVMSAREGARIGFRVRFPYLRSKESNRPVAVIVYGADYDDTGSFASIGVGLIEADLRLKMIAVRREYGATADLSDPYVDAVVINAYSGPGTTTLRLDELSVDGMVTVGDYGRVPSLPEQEPAPMSASRVSSAGTSSTLIDEAAGNTAFPVGRVTRILQHNGEPLTWVRSLGFDAVLLAQPADAAILREAIRSRIAVYSPPPTAPDASIQPLLDPVLGWYIGSDVALDSRHVDETAVTSQRLKSWPSVWRRPLVAAPAETWQRYAPLVDAMIDDLAIRARGVRGDEEVAEMMHRQRQVGGRIQNAVGIASMPPASALLQTEAIADAIGAPRPDSFHWHSMWLQAIRSLESTPKAILFRSTRSLASGSELDSQRAMSLSYVNRMIAMLAPWVVEATPSPPPPVSGPYRCGRLATADADLLLLTSTASRGGEALSGDGETIEIALSPDESSKNAWRLTHFSAERIAPEVTDTGARIQIVSPDVVEIIVLSSDPSIGAKLSTSAQRFARQAGSDRWELTRRNVRQTRDDWNLAISSRATNRSAPAGLLRVAERTLADAEPLYRAGDVDASLRMARRADAWALRCRWQLSEALMPDWPHPTSCPPLLCNAAPVQIAWHPLMSESGWGINRLTSGSLDSADLINPERWSFGRRMIDRAGSEVAFVSRGVFSGAGALRTTVTSKEEDDLPGGYEGTVIQIRSPAVRLAAGQAFRIDAMVRTLGFGGPHQGLLVYDTTGGQEMGLLIRGGTDWTPVRLYRQATVESDVHVMFEVLGAGEATIDEVRLQLWEPKPPAPIPFRPLSERNADQSLPSNPVQSTRR